MYVKEIEKNFNIVPQMWAKASTDGTFPTLTSLMNGDINGLLGVSACGNADDWRYYIAVASTLETPAEFEEYEVPAATWAIFTGKGNASSIQELEVRIVKEWLPTSGYEYDNAPDIEVYISPDPENAEFEVWVPVVKKQA